jgi:hypothetical protein
MTPSFHARAPAGKRHFPRPAKAHNKHPPGEYRAPHPELTPKLHDPDDSVAARVVYRQGQLLGSIAPADGAFLARDRRGRPLGPFSPTTVTRSTRSPLRREVRDHPLSLHRLPPPQEQSEWLAMISEAA